MDGSAQIPARQATCVLWHARGAPPPSKLRQAISAKSMIDLDADEPFGALALLCRAARAGTNLPTVLLMVEPGGLPGPGAMSRMVERYAEGAVMWVYEESAAPQLRALTAEDVSHWKELAATGTAPSVRPPATTSVASSAPSLSYEGETRVAAAAPRPSIRRTGIGRPRLRLAGNGQLPQGDDLPTESVHVREPGGTKERGEPAPSRAILSDAELAMLLADGPGQNEQ